MDLQTALIFGFSACVVILYLKNQRDQRHYNVLGNVHKGSKDNYWISKPPRDVILEQQVKAQTKMLKGDDTGGLLHNQYDEFGIIQPF